MTMARMPLSVTLNPISIITTLLVRFGVEFGLRHIWIQDRNVFHEYNWKLRIFYQFPMNDITLELFGFILRQCTGSLFVYYMHSNLHDVGSGELWSLLLLWSMEAITTLWTYDLLQGDDLNDKLQNRNKIYICNRFVSTFVTNLFLNTENGCRKRHNVALAQVELCLR